MTNGPNPANSRRQLLALFVWLLRALSLVALLSLSSLVHATQFRDCDDGLQLICADGDSLAPVDSTVFAGNPIFNKHFTVFLCWEPGAPGATGAPGSRWDEDDLREFANIVVDSLAGDVSGMAKSILDYFGEDAFASVDTLFGIQTKTGAPAGQDTTYTHFGIYIFDTCRVINATHEYVTAHIEGQDGQFLTPWEVARDAFAHSGSMFATTAGNVWIGAHRYSRASTKCALCFPHPSTAWMAPIRTRLPMIPRSAITEAALTTPRPARTRYP